MITPARLLRTPVDGFGYYQALRWKPISIQKEITVGMIRDIVRDVTGFDPYFTPKDRYRGFVEARQLFLYFVMKYTKSSQKAAGKLVGKDHATAYYAKVCVNKFRHTEPRYARLWNIIDNKLSKNAL